MPNIMVGFNQRVNLVACYLLILSILRRNKLEMFHEDTASRQELDRRDHLLLRYCLFTVETFLYFSFCFSGVPRPDDFSPITGIKVMTSGKAFDCFEIYTIVPIVRIELTSIQAIEVVPVAQSFAIGCPGSISIIMIVPIVWTLYQTTGTIGTIMWKPGLTVFFLPQNQHFRIPICSVFKTT